jgi:hypothetical protein
VVAVRIFEVAPVTCEVPQRFLLSSDLGSTALSQLYSFFFFGFWFPNRGRGVFEVAAGELQGSSTPQLPFWTLVRSVFPCFIPLFNTTASVLDSGFAVFSSLLYSFVQHHSFHSGLWFAAFFLLYSSVFLRCSFWFRVLPLHRAAAEESLPPTT